MPILSLLIANLTKNPFKNATVVPLQQLITQDVSGLQKIVLYLVRASIIF